MGVIGAATAEEDANAAAVIGSDGAAVLAGTPAALVANAVVEDGVAATAAAVVTVETPASGRGANDSAAAGGGDVREVEPCVPSVGCCGGKAAERSPGGAPSGVTVVGDTACPFFRSSFNGPAVVARPVTGDVTFGARKYFLLTYLARIHISTTEDVSRSLGLP